MKRELYDEQVLQSQLSDPTQRRKAFEIVVRKFSSQIYWQIRRLVFSHDDADDILQNTFMKAWSSLETFRGDSKISTWLFRIATNESLSFLQRKREQLSLDDPEASVVNSLSSEEYFDGDEAQHSFMQAIASLPDKQRLVFNMRYFDEMKYDEISEVLGTSVGALKASYHIAVEKITTLLKKMTKPFGIYCV